MRAGVIASLVVLSFITGAEAQERLEMESPERAEFTVTVLYDNRAGASGLDPAWGFACLIRGLEKTILFDTGGDAPTLLGNMAKLEIAPDSADVVVLSHGHSDHTGGLAGFLDVHGDVAAYVLEAFPDEIGERARERGADVIEIREPVEICAGATLTGRMGGRWQIAEQALILSGDDGVALVTGCAHPGIVDIVARAKELTGRDVLVVIGGFHLLKHRDSDVLEVIARLKELGVEYAVPCHCTGDAAIDRFAEHYGDAFVQCTAGAVIPVGELLRRTESGPSSE